MTNILFEESGLLLYAPPGIDGNVHDEFLMSQFKRPALHKQDTLEEWQKSLQTASNILNRLQNILPPNSSKELIEDYISKKTTIEDDIKDFEIPDDTIHLYNRQRIALELFASNSMTSNMLALEICSTAYFLKTKAMAQHRAYEGILYCSQEVLDKVQERLDLEKEF